MKKLIYVAVAVVLAILVTGCVESAKDDESKSVVKSLVVVDSRLDIYRFHDDEMNVTCWLNDSGRMAVPPTMSCIPDSQLR